MGFPPVREDNPRALASGLSYVQADNPGHASGLSYEQADNPWNNYYLYHLDLAHHAIFRAKVGKGGIRRNTLLRVLNELSHMTTRNKEHSHKNN